MQLCWGEKGSTTHIYLSRNKGGRNADTKYKIGALRCAHRKELGEKLKDDDVELKISKGEK
jgi:hypothetical protein